MDEVTRQALRTLQQQVETLRTNITTNQRLMTELAAKQQESIRILREQNQALTATLLATLETLVAKKAFPPLALLDKAQHLLNLRESWPNPIYRQWTQVMAHWATGELVSDWQRRSLLHSVPAPEVAAPPKVD